MSRMNGKKTHTHTAPIGNFIQYCSVRVSLYVLDFDSRMGPILVVEITYDFGLRIETGTERPLLLYIIYQKW